MADALRMRIVRDNSAAWSVRLRARVQIELRGFAVLVLARASDLAPKETGALSESGEIQQLSELMFAVVFGRGLPDGRAIYQEMGTAVMAAQPYLYPAFIEMLPSLMSRLAITTQGRIRVMPGLGAGPEITS